MDAHTSRSLHFTSLILLGLAAVLLFTLQFLPWGTYEEHNDQQIPTGGFGGGGMSFQSDVEVTTYTWQGDVAGALNGQGGRDSSSWLSSDWDGADGTGRMATGAFFLVFSLAIVVAGLVLDAFLFGNAGGMTALSGTVLGLVGFILFASGQDAFYGDADFTLHVGFYFALVAVAIAAVGSVLCFLGLQEGTSEGGPRAQPAVQARIDFD